MAVFYVLQESEDGSRDIQPEVTLGPLLAAVLPSEDQDQHVRNKRDYDLSAHLPVDSG